MKSLLADAILATHFLFTVFVVAGQACILAGGVRGWRWVRHFGLRLAHLLAIAFVVAESWIGVICPLTAWESALRRGSGEPSSPGTFVGHWMGRLIYYQAPEWVFTAVYTVFGTIVLASWFLVRPDRRRSRPSSL